MPNSYFQFRQFTVNQQHCAMKVCTDACLFGAWVAQTLIQKQLTVKNILDIGTGTGLLSLMLAQKTTASIDAIELDPAAAAEAADNFSAGPWSDRLTIIEADAAVMQLWKQYDLIVSNPPFFENDLTSPDPKRNLALHSTALGFKELLGAVKKHLAPGGYFAVLLPYHRKTSFTELATEEGFFLQEEVNVKQTGRHPYFRSMLLWGSDENDTVVNELVIKDGERYAKAFAELLGDFYLKI